ncbi:HPF/RaiA family ribosome-associated protein [Candidatus Accumulibacter vicinus]|uniref:Ribosomal subunit interface protein n=1 Tax=Candidatus Accumulibacter vicinus TaxID=2954382 RepID=A0A084Y5B4_9PROT|nr:HPF/RaiA family ribosome-associated protein [Candidatus Accumulibacter vicinus]KFB69908.1 MAG: ribosomal subunit interface protein [Candidatus Accumulibacter vicinus]
MQIFIQARGFDLSAGLREHVERRIHFALDWANQHVRKVSIRLSDLNGPRGGEDKCCSIQVAVLGAADVLIEDIEPDLYVAIDRATDRAGRTLARQVARQREYRHDSPRDGRAKNAAIVEEADSTKAASSSLITRSK